MAQREKKPIVTQKHLARDEREALQKKYILITTGIIIAAVVFLIGFGLVYEGIVKPQRPVAQVNETEITTKEFQALVRFQRYNLVNQYANYYQFIQQLGDPNAFSYFESTLLQIENQLQPEFLGYQSIENLIENALIQQDAERLGIEVTREEVEKEIAETVFQYYEGDPPPTAELAAAAPTSTLSPLQMTLVAPTAEVPETAAETVENTETGETSPDPTPTAYTEKAFKDDYDIFVDNFRSFAKISEKDIFRIFEMQLLRQKLLDVVVPEVDTEEEKIWAHHILFQDEENGESQAQAFYERIQNGEHFKTVAEELSAITDPENPPAVRFENLGWFGTGMMVPEFETAAYQLEIGEVSEPVQTSFGWHVIQVIGREVQPIDEATQEQMKLNIFSEYLAGLRAEAQIDIKPDWTSVVPTDPEIPETMRITSPELTTQDIQE